MGMFSVLKLGHALFLIDCITFVETHLSRSASRLYFRGRGLFTAFLCLIHSTYSYDCFKRAGGIVRNVQTINHLELITVELVIAVYYAWITIVCFLFHCRSSLVIDL